MLKIDGVILKSMIISGANNLYNNYPEIDNLNVFPVPDGDTGTNMNLTMASGVQEVFNKTDSSISQVATDFANGLFNGGRGNSGVILSAIFKGFALSLKGKDSVDAIGLADAFVSGKVVAYKGVITPVEGTILTVIREASQALYDQVKPNMPIDKCMDILYDEAVKSLNRTPELLPVLKEVGVVDSGGAGLCKILEGFARALHNDIIEKNMPSVTEVNVDYSSSKPTDTNVGNVQSKFAHKEFGYCTQFLLNLADQEKLPKNKKAYNEKRFKAVLEAHGNSIVYSRNDELVKIHIHTLKPGDVLTYAQQFGEFKAIKVDNMSEQHEELMLDDAKEKEKNGFEASSGTIDVKTSAAPTVKVNPVKKNIGIISVAVGKGIEELFKELQVDYIVSGGQTMNPSTEDFVKAIKAIDCKNVIILPNNGNIIMASNQAAEIMKDVYNVKVIPTKMITEGLTACMVFNPESSIDDNISSMTEAYQATQAGEVTYAVRDTSIDGMKVNKGQFIGIQNKKIVSVNDDKVDTLLEMIDKMLTEDSEIITVYCGEDITSDVKDAIEEKLNDKYSSDYDVQVLEGGQPVYSFFVSVE